METCLVEGCEVEGIGGYLDISDDTSGFIDRESHLYPAPVKLSATLSREITPTAIEPLVAAVFFIKFSDVVGLHHFIEADLYRLLTINRSEGLNQRLDNVEAGHFGQFGQVHHTAANRRHTMLLQLGRFDTQVALQIVHIARNQDCSVVKTHVTAFGKGIAAEFAPLAQQVVATAYLRLQPVVRRIT